MIPGYMTFVKNHTTGYWMFTALCASFGDAQRCCDHLYRDEHRIVCYSESVPNGERIC